MIIQPSGINGILNVFKPPGMTSHDVINYLRRTLKEKKAGHTGTLDPNVAGVLVVCLGKATRVIEYLDDNVKCYRAEITFGSSTDTQDGYGQVLKTNNASGISWQEAEKALLAVKGLQQQLPPMVSAVKHKGRKLYEIAREGLEVERRPRTIEVFDIKMIKHWRFGTPNPSLLFDITCSRGTYVRTICHDLGESLGLGAYMSFLARTGSGQFHLDDSLLLEEIVSLYEQGQLQTKLIPIDQVLPFEEVWVHDDTVKSIQHGNLVYEPGVLQQPAELRENQHVKLMTSKAGCLAVARVSVRQNDKAQSLNSQNGLVFQPVKVFC
ncbi:tRNA pseudouridine(55) synthase TruB [Phosphitispora sp. TUW77]|uniref:tRNA pseudouridine(55) synthase TruB n=1 Tax=Phosphitispora sp. TUW77 TaxID=3152361 RepID=UPI003AB75F8C